MGPGRDRTRDPWIAVRHVYVIKVFRNVGSDNISRKLVLISNMQKSKSMMMMYYPNVLNIDDCNITEDQNSCLKNLFLSSVILQSSLFKAA